MARNKKIDIKYRRNAEYDTGDENCGLLYTIDQIIIETKILIHANKRNKKFAHRYTIKFFHATDKSIVYFFILITCTRIKTKSKKPKPSGYQKKNYRKK